MTRGVNGAANGESYSLLGTEAAVPNKLVHSGHQVDIITYRKPPMYQNI